MQIAVPRTITTTLKRLVALAGALAISISPLGTVLAARDGDRSGLRISIVFNNIPYASGLQTAWGFAAVVEGLGKTLLFDTGGNGALLLARWIDSPHDR